MVALFDEAYLQISNSNFTNNEASLGGVISGQYYTSASFHQCSFQENIGKCNPSSTFPKHINNL